MGDMEKDIERIFHQDNDGEAILKNELSDQLVRNALMAQAWQTGYRAGRQDLAHELEVKLMKDRHPGKKVIVLNTEQG